MNFENLYLDYQKLEKELKDKLSAAQKLQKAILRDMEAGDIKSCKKNIAVLTEVTAEQQRVTGELNQLVEAFNTAEYFENGEFAEQMLSECEKAEVDVKGEFPIYQMFPYKIKIDSENQDIYVDRKKLQCMRPSSLVKKIKLGREKLYKATFNAVQFANELADAYDLAVMKEKKQPQADFYLTGIYKYLTPMGRFRKDYDLQSFAFDIARLYSSGLKEVKDGRSFQFGPSRNNNKAIRILDSEGREQYLATIRFYN